MKGAVDPSGGMWDEAKCPMHDCGEPLHIVWTLDQPILLSSTASDLRDPSGADVGGWEVVCLEGHVILLPVSAPGASRDLEEFGDDYHREDDPSILGDLDRLRRLLGLPLDGAA